MSGPRHDQPQWADLFGIDPDYGREQTTTAPEPGDTLYGFCGGYFGRDSYGEKIVVAVGRDWLVARDGGQPVFAAVDPARLAVYLTDEDFDA